MMDRRQKIAYALASDEVGMREVKGPQHNPDIVQMFADVGHAWVKDDETAWCAAFVGAMLERAGLPSMRKLTARSYMDWGKPAALDDAQPGDVIIFSRGDPKGWQGHVGFFVRHAGTHIEVLGGNQSNAVSIARYPVSRLLGVRRWPVEQPVGATAPAPEPEAPKPGFLAALIAAILALFRRKP
jgi:uncharacterized protein (TIGR02594 family)